ncbi:neutrophil gelatinase-associated lipocalin-like [Ornithorhynchus anatinus]|uniref:Lipocalin/cytosolic fatty-acid binding domain-containing protein n=1 Tax=Ornithorhynchus anatinus TaxID=9258 RepID=A0A6I8NFI7_ORNAN|nr:neutrophil gelatinase-associated lipocalin-like [Ornithorhynchus anatinus]
MKTTLLCIGLTLFCSRARADVPVQPDFQPDKFQGRWYVVGLAVSSAPVEGGSFKMYATTYRLLPDQSFNVTSTLLRGERCDKWVRTFVRKDRPGRLTLGNVGAYGVKDYTVSVMETNYEEYSIVHFKKVVADKTFYKITLYGRTKELRPELKERFVRVAKEQGLKDDHVGFLPKVDKCIDED